MPSRSSWTHSSKHLKRNSVHRTLLSPCTFALEEADGVQMGKITATGKGQHYILPSPEDIPYSFGDAIGRLLCVSAKCIKVAFTPLIRSASSREANLKDKAPSFNASAWNVSEKEKIKFLVSLRFTISSSPASIKYMNGDFTWDPRMTYPKHRYNEFQYLMTMPLHAGTPTALLL